MKGNRPPIAIAITMGKEVVEANGGLLTFIPHLESALDGSDGSYWLHKCKNRPTQEVDQIYIVIHNQVRYRVYFGGYGNGETSVYMHSGEERVISWPRMILAGPFEKAPRKIPMKGFQGFRYVFDPIF